MAAAVQDQHTRLHVAIAGLAVAVFGWALHARYYVVLWAIPLTCFRGWWPRTAGTRAIPEEDGSPSPR